MREVSAFLLAAVLALGPSSAAAQTKTPVVIRISSDTCRVVGLSVPCGEIGSKLREMGIPSDTDIHLEPDSQAPYEAISALLESLQRAGFKFKLGTVNVRDP